MPAVARPRPSPPRGGAPLRPRFVVLAPLAVAALVGLQLARTLPAQSTDEVYGGVQFNLSNPGARSLGLAGAFSARPDDATAAYANPAGLVALTKLEVAVDWRSFRFSDDVVLAGRNSTPGSAEGFRVGSASAALDGISFVAVSVPSSLFRQRSAPGINAGSAAAERESAAPLRPRWVISFFGHQLVDYATRIATDGAFACCNERGIAELLRPIDAALELEVRSAGGAVAWLVRDGLSLGASLTVDEMSLRGVTERLDRPRFEPGASVRNFQVQDGDDDGSSLTLGALWSPYRHLSLAAVARWGERFRFTADSFDRVVDFAGNESFRSRFPEGPPAGTFVVPDVYSLGASYEPSLFWVLSFEAARVEYSAMTRSLLDLLGVDSALGRGVAGEPADFRVGDGTELRFGVEYGIPADRLPLDLFLRFGVWHDPDHEIRYVGENPQLQAIWRRGDDEIHTTAGLGIRSRRIQVDLAADLSRRLDTGSVSLVYYFGR